MADPHDDRADHFMLDTLRLAYALDAVTARDWQDSIVQAVRQGNHRFAELLLRRTSVRLSAEDEALMDWVLDTIRARLKFLQRRYRCNLSN